MIDFQTNVIDVIDMYKSIYEEHFTSISNDLLDPEKFKDIKVMIDNIYSNWVNQILKYAFDMMDKFDEILLNNGPYIKKGIVKNYLIELIVVKKKLAVDIKKVFAFIKKIYQAFQQM